MSFCCKCKAGICKTQDCDSFCDCHPQEYPNDKETQEWMNAPLGVPDVDNATSSQIAEMLNRALKALGYKLTTNILEEKSYPPPFLRGREERK